MNEYYNNLAGAIAEGDISSANEIIMSQLGKYIATNREDFIEVLETSGISFRDNPKDIDLIEAFIDNSDNDSLLLNVAIIVNHGNKVLNFDGEPELSDAGVKATYKVLSTYFEPYVDIHHGASGEITSNGWGDFANNIVTTGAGIYQDVKNKKTGGQDAFNKSKESRNQLVQSIVAQKQAQIEAQSKVKEQKEKTNRTIMIASAVGISLIILGGVYLAIKKKK